MMPLALFCATRRFSESFIKATPWLKSLVLCARRSAFPALSASLSLSRADVCMLGHRRSSDWAGTSILVKKPAQLLGAQFLE